jgi:hypothetical protein
MTTAPMMAQALRRIVDLEDRPAAATRTNLPASPGQLQRRLTAGIAERA